MKVFGSFSELVSLIFRKNSQAITLRPNQTTTYTGARDIQTPEQDANSILISRDSTDTVINKSISGSSNTITNVSLTTGVTGVLPTTNGGTGQNSTATFPTSGTILNDSNTVVVTGKTIDGDDNTVQDLPITSLKTVLADANKVLRRDAAGVAQSGNTIPNTSALVTTDATQDLSNKELTAALIDDYLDYNEESAPSTPASGKGRTWVSTDGTFKFTNDAGLTKTLGDAGSGELNNIDNPSDATNWVASGAGITVATTTTTTDLPLEGIIDTAIKITPVSSTDYVRYRFTMPASLKNTKLKIQWNQRPLSGYASGDLKVEMYQNSASDYSGSYTEFSLSTDNSGTSSIPNTTGRYVTTFDADSSDYYELRIVRTAGTTALNLANVIVGPGVQPQGAVLGPWQEFTISIKGSVSDPTLGTSGINKAFWRRNGEDMDIRWDFRQTTGGAAGSGVYYFDLSSIPGNYHVDTNKLTSFPQEANSVLGTAQIFTGTTYAGYARLRSTNQQISFVFGADGQANVEWGSTTFSLANNPFHASFQLQVPIAEFVGAGVVNTVQNDVEYAFNTNATDAADTTSFGSGAAGTPFPGVTYTSARAKRIRFSTPIQPSDVLAIEVDPRGTGNFIDFNTWFLANGTQMVNTFQVQNATSYGFARVQPVSGSDTDVDLLIGQYCDASGATYAAAGTNWNADSGVARWRVAKRAGGQAVGFGAATDTSLGLVLKKQAVVIVNNSTTSISNAGTTNVTWGTEVVDTNNVFVPGTGTFTAPYTGYYQCTALVTFTGMAGTTLITSKWVRAGSTNYNLYQSLASSTGGKTLNSALIPLTAGETLVFVLSQNDAGSRSLNGGTEENYMTIHFVSDN